MSNYSEARNIIRTVERSNSVETWAAVATTAQAYAMLAVADEIKLVREMLAESLAASHDAIERADDLDAEIRRIKDALIVEKPISTERAAAINGRTFEEIKRAMGDQS